MLVYKLLLDVFDVGGNLVGVGLVIISVVVSNNLLVGIILLSVRIENLLVLMYFLINVSIMINEFRILVCL